jgi:hypothetical protein
MIFFLQNLIIQYSPPSLEENSSRNRQTTTKELYLPQSICNILFDETWWSSISELVMLMKPYCGALDQMQADKARLYDVAISFGFFIKFWEGYSDRTFAEGMILRLQKRWESWEQPLLLLSILLHPSYRMQMFNPDLESINYVTLSKFLVYYYKAWEKKKPMKILTEFELYRSKKFPFDNETVDQFKDDILGFWNFASLNSKELGIVATKIFSITVNSASVERLFSTMGFLHTSRRNAIKVSI